MHKTLALTEEKEFRQWARDNFKDFNSPNPSIIPTWHPVVQNECERMSKEYKTGLRMRIDGYTSAQVDKVIKEMRSNY